MAASFSTHVQVQQSFSAFFGRIRNFIPTRGAINAQYSVPILAAPLLLVFLQLKYQGKPKPPFETRPISTYVATVSSLVYCLAYASLRLSPRRFPARYLRIVCFCAWFFGQLLLASMASVLFSNSVAFVPYLLYFVLAVGELVHCANCGSRGGQRPEWLLRGRFGQVQDFLMSLCSRVVNRGADQTQILPVHV